jgi:hypothetical protein
MEQGIIYEEDEVAIFGRALYNGNETAPVETSNVTIKALGSGLEDNTTTDFEGNFSVVFTIDTAGDYDINTTVKNRTMTGYDEFAITVHPLLISDVSQILEKSTCYPDTEFWVNGTATYNSGKSVVNSDVNISINETLYWTGITDSNGNYSILITSPNDTGEFDVNVTITNGSRKGYNESSILVTAVPLPDLVITTEDITFVSAHDPFLENDEINITAEIDNSGTADATNVKVLFYIGDPSLGNFIGDFTISNIIFGESSTAYVTWTAINGTHKIWVVVDPLDAVSESFEDNNEAFESIYVENDTDGDGIGDNSDDDIDGDGIFNSNDDFPYDHSEWLDTDDDGIGNNADTDDDDDGYLDPVDAFPIDKNEWNDTDGDETGDNADNDDDNDGLTDIEEEALGTNPRNSDSDGDGENDFDDYYPLDPKRAKKEAEEDSTLWYIMIIIMIIIVVLVIVFLLYRRKNG